MVRRPRAFAAALGLLVGARVARAQDSLRVDSLGVTANWDVARAQPREPTLAFTLSRPLRPGAERLAVIVGISDLSALLDVSGTRALLPLRGERIEGDAEVRAYVVSTAGVWREAGRFPFRRVTAGGFDSAAVKPAFDVQSTGQVDAHVPQGAAPAASQQGLSGNAGFDASLKRGRWDATVQGQSVGASKEQARLRASQLGPRAPAVDLASYNLRLTDHVVGLSAGHFAIGDDRHLLNQFRSRGLSADLALPHGLTFAVASVAGSELVGWDDPLGVARPSHRLLSGTIGIDAVPSRPGLVRLELTTLHGRVQPQPAFSQQAVTDREQSDGIGAQLTAADPSGRIRLVTGLASSRFTNPADRGLSGDSTLVAVRPERRQARFADATVDVLRGAHLFRAPASLSLTAHEERVDPQYRSVGATVQADRDQTGLDATASLDALQLQFATSSGRDNLARIPSLLTTRLRGESLNAALPLAQLVRAAPAAWWWPALNASWQASWQAGEATPQNGGFRLPSQIPNQRTDNVVTSAAWQRASWTITGHLNYSVVDNRQPTRENADFFTTAPGVTVGLTPSPRLTLNVDLSDEAQESVERAAHATNRRLSLQSDWRPVGLMALNATVSVVSTDDPATTQRHGNTELAVEASQGFNLFGHAPSGAQGRLFARYSRAAASLAGPGAVPAPSQWALTSGLSARLF
jgi:hypothetical protein